MGLAFRVWGLGMRTSTWRVQGLGFRDVDQYLEAFYLPDVRQQHRGRHNRVPDRVQGLGFRVQGSGFRV